MSRKRPKSLDAPVVMQARRLEVWAYVRCDQWKRTYRHTLVNDFRKHITDAKNEIIRAFELPNKMRNEKGYLGFLKWCNAYRLRKQVCDRVRGSVLGMVLEPAEDNHKVTTRRGYTKTSYYKREYKELKHMLAA